MGEPEMLLYKLLDIYSWILIIRVLLSWFSVNPYNPVVRILYAVTEPVLAPIRRAIPPMGGLDLSPLVVFAAIWVIKIML